MTLYLYKLRKALLEAQIRVLDKLIRVDGKILEYWEKRVEELSR